MPERHLENIQVPDRKPPSHLILSNVRVAVFIALTITIIAVLALSANIRQIDSTPEPVPRASLDTIDFAGYTWDVKSSGGEMADPGPNLWNNSAESVWVDTRGRLHMEIRNDGSRWYSSEIDMQKPLGFGKYVFNTESAVGRYDRNVIAAMFLYGFSNEDLEVDLEFGKFGGNGTDNGWFSVQPVTPQSQDSFPISTSGDNRLTNTIDWTPDRIFFQINDSMGVREQWTYAGPFIPKEADGLNAVINFWLYYPAPFDGKSAEFIVSNFTFTPE